MMLKFVEGAREDDVVGVTRFASCGTTSRFFGGCWRHALCHAFASCGANRFFGGFEL